MWSMRPGRISPYSPAVVVTARTHISRRAPAASLIQQLSSHVVNVVTAVLCSNFDITTWIIIEHVGWLVGWSLTALLTQFRSYRAFKVKTLL